MTGNLKKKKAWEEIKVKRKSINFYNKGGFIKQFSIDSFISNWIREQSKWNKVCMC